MNVKSSNRKRYRKVSWFFLKITLQVIWWDVVLRRPVLRRFRTPHISRWQQIARDYRDLAVEMGGVLIKLGQFLSVRVDILPEEVTSELGGLQDEVPAEAYADIVRQIETEFSQPIAEVFPWLATEVLGAASLAQAHRARLPSGETVVVKVLRPGIESIVETDLAAIGQFVRRLKLYPPVNRTVDLDRLIEEFDRVTIQELDLLLEGQHAERFAENFADDVQISSPSIHWDYCTTRTLTMEDVGYLPIDDLVVLGEAGIDPDEVAAVLSRATLEQVLIYYLVHADPHSGNLFVKPLPTEEEIAAGITAFAPGQIPPPVESRSFQIVYVDFGMSVEVAPWLRASIREYMIGAATGDAHRIVQSYVDGDMLLPGADVDRLEEMTEDMLRRFGDSLLGQAQNIDFFEYNSFIMNEYRDLIENPPIQFQVELLFVLRAVGLVSGMTAQLSPDFDPQAQAMPVIRQLMQDEVQNNWQDWVREAGQYAQIALRMPKRLDTLLTQAERQRLTVQTKPSPEARREMRQLRQSITRVTWVMAAGALFLGGVLWRVGDTIADALLGVPGPRGVAAPSSLLLAASVIVFVIGMRRGR